MKPKLKPISGIIKPITYKRKTFIPLEQLFYMLHDVCYFGYFDVLDNEHTTTFQIDDDWNHIMNIQSGKRAIEFGYDKLSQSFHLTGIKSNGDIEELSVAPQLILFDTLTDWGFDIYLINEE